MSSLSIRLCGPAEYRLPALGQGLWVNQLHEPAAVAQLVEQLNSAYLELLVDVRDARAFTRLAVALDLCVDRGIDAWLLVVVDDMDPHGQLLQLAEVANPRATAVRGLLVTPAAYLESYQPDGQWPSGLTPSQAGQLAREYMPNVMIGGGVPTYFTELNRCRPAPDSFDYLTHATSPIVHTADDHSVMESLQALPDIFRSARHLAAGKPYRLTTSAIGAWRNPYGGQLTLNPLRQRVTLSDQDPRQKGLIGAAWTLAQFQAAHQGGVNAIALWAVNEPFAAAGQSEYWPIFHLLKGLLHGAGRVAIALEIDSESIACVAWLDGKARGTVQLWLANLGDQAQSLVLDNLTPTHYRVLDTDRFTEALVDPLYFEHPEAVGSDFPCRLDPYAVMVIHARATVEQLV